MQETYISKKREILIITKRSPKSPGRIWTKLSNDAPPHPYQRPASPERQIRGVRRNKSRPHDPLRRRSRPFRGGFSAPPERSRPRSPRRHTHVRLYFSQR